MRSFLYKILEPLGIAFSWLTHSRIRVLAYHEIKDPEVFEQQIVYLKKHYSIVSVQQLTDYFEKRTPLPQGALLITFDDGDISIVNDGLHILKKHNVPAALFIITGLIESRNAFWWKKVEKNYLESGRSYSDARQFVRRLKDIPNGERLALLSALKEADYPQLTLNHLDQLAESRIAITNHSHTHPMFNRCTSSEIADDLAQSEIFFRKFQQGYYHIFAYPNGSYDDLAEEALKKAGIKYAFLFDHRLNGRSIDPMRISRIRVNADDDLPEFKVRVSGLHSMISRVR